MSAHVLLNLLNKVGKKIRCKALTSVLLVFLNEFNKFNNTGAVMQDSNYHDNKIAFCIISDSCSKTSRCQIM